MTGSDGMWLAIDCSGPAGSVAVGRGGRAVTEVVLNVSGGLSAALMPAIDFAMQSAGVAPADLGGVVVGAGPGSFTGLRVAAGTAKGIVHALEVPLVAYSSLLVTAAPFHRGAVGVLFDARGRNVYGACYDFGGHSVRTLTEPAAMDLEQALSRFGEHGVSLLVGDGASRHEEEISARLSVPVVPDSFSSPRAGALLWLAEEFPDSGVVASATNWEPDYLRASGAERIAAEARTSAARSVGEAR